MSVEQYQNLAYSTCTGSLDNSTNPITVVVASGDGALFPATTNGPFRITVCDAAGTNAEVMIVTARATDTLTAYRGTQISAQGAAETPVPTLSTHSAGSVVSHSITAGAMDQIRQDIFGYGTFANRPTTPRAIGAIYRASDTFVDEYRWNGTSWDGFVGNILISPTLSTSTFTASAIGTAGVVSTFVNQGGTGGGILFIGSSTNSAIDAVITKLITAPATPYNVTLRFNWTVPVGAKFEEAGIVLRESSSGKLHVLTIAYEGNAYSFGSTPTLRIGKWTSVNAFSGNYYEQSFVSSVGRSGLYHFRITDDGTNRISKISADGHNWVTVHTIGRTDFLTPDQIGVVIAPYSAQLQMSIVDFTVS